MKNPWVTWMAFAGTEETPGSPLGSGDDEVEAVVLDHIFYFD